MNKVRAPALTIIVIQFEAFDFSLTLPQKKIPKYSLRFLHTRLSCWRRPCYFYVCVCEGFSQFSNFMLCIFQENQLQFRNLRVCVCVFCIEGEGKRKTKLQMS